MRDRKGKKSHGKAKFAVVGQGEVNALRGHFAGELLRPMLGLVENMKASIEELLNETARSFVEGVARAGTRALSA